MTLWQYTAYAEAFDLRVQDDLCTQIQAAYYQAYWNSSTKHKKSLKKIIDSVRQDPYKTVKKINFTSIEEQFNKAEELMYRGWTKQ